LGMGRRHPVAFPEHFWKRSDFSLSRRVSLLLLSHTLWSFFFDNSLEGKIECFTTHLPSKHENYLHFSRGPDKGHVGHT
jgi:hypothetical protein